MSGNQISFTAVEVSGSACEDCFEVMLNSQEESEEPSSSIEDYDWDAPYLLIQRVAMDEEEDESLYVETHRPELSGQVSRLEVTVTGDTFVAAWDRGTATIRLNPADDGFPEFLQVLRTIVPAAQITGSDGPGCSE